MSGPCPWQLRQRREQLAPQVPTRLFEAAPEPQTGCLLAAAPKACERNQNECLVLLSIGFQDYFSSKFNDEREESGAHDACRKLDEMLGDC